MRLIVDARPFAEPVRGGVGRVALEIVDAYADSFPDDEIICATTGSAIPKLESRLTVRPNVKHIHIKIPNKFWSALSIVGAVSLFEQTEKRSGKADAFFMPNLGFAGRLPKNVPSVLLMHDLSFLIEPRWFSRKQRLWHKAVKAAGAIRGATKLLAVSETTKRDAMRLLGIKDGKVEVIPIGTTLGANPSQPPLEPRGGEIPSRYCLALGLGDPRKNAATAIEAVRMLRMEEGFGDLGLVIVGARHALPAGDACVAPTWLQTISNPTDSELASLYANAAAFLYPSWYEGYGLPLHEAASFGTPCIASTSGALPGTAPVGTVFSNPAKPHHWVEAIKLALGQPKQPYLSNKKNWDQAAEMLNKSF
ncbi:glycosyltransferase family 4 protein [Candidatus Uhrbacteria bacterium]|nr:glycosyltransferase family 4 protein [Candidatus Uhrbacteria bacterium]